MTSIIMYALILALLQYWLLPVSCKMKESKWLLSSRDEPREKSVFESRVDRAAANLRESLAPFLVMCLLAIHNSVDLTTVATVWLVLRTLYVPCYLFGINPIRSLIWMGSLGCLIYMGFMLM